MENIKKIFATYKQVSEIMNFGSNPFCRNFSSLDLNNCRCLSVTDITCIYMYICLLYTNQIDINIFNNANFSNVFNFCKKNTNEKYIIDFLNRMEIKEWDVNTTIKNSDFIVKVYSWLVLKNDSDALNEIKNYFNNPVAYLEESEKQEKIKKIIIEATLEIRKIINNPNMSNESEVENFVKEFLENNCTIEIQKDENSYHKPDFTYI